MTDKGRCPVCQGSKRVRLELWHAVSWPPETDDMIREVSRQYDCPECVPMVRCERVGAVKVKAFMEDGRMTPELKELWRKDATRYLGRSIAERLMEGFVKIETLPPDAYHGEGIMATIRVVTPDAMQSFDERVAERQMEVADEVAEEARRLINNWGSYYEHDTISKSTAWREIGCAVRNVKARRDAG